MKRIKWPSFLKLINNIKYKKTKQKKTTTTKKKKTSDRVYNGPPKEGAQIE
jgi:hypothetical protein